MSGCEPVTCGLRTTIWTEDRKSESKQQWQTIDLSIHCPELEPDFINRGPLSPPSLGCSRYLARITWEKFAPFPFPLFHVFSWSLKVWPSNPSLKKSNYEIIKSTVEPTPQFFIHAFFLSWCSLFAYILIFIIWFNDSSFVTFYDQRIELVLCFTIIITTIIIIIMSIKKLKWCDFNYT